MLLLDASVSIAGVDEALIEQAVTLATEHGLTAYDAAYAAAAHMYSWTLVSADLKGLVKPGLAVAPDDPQI
jgi:predicted nucleic acid-binding protein